MIQQWLKYYKWRFLHPIIPCAMCKLPSGLLICNHCLSELEINTPPYCNFCAKPGENICSSCSDNPPAFSHTYCQYRYATPLNKMLHKLKYKFDKSNVWALGYLMAKSLSNIKPDTDFIVPMPLSKERQHERGFNQVEELLRYYQKTFWHLPIKTNIAKKIINTPHQTLLKLENRKNTENLYQIKKNVTGKNILIVDDVITSGSTANNLATALKSAGARRVELCAFLRTV